MMASLRDEPFIWTKKRIAFVLNDFIMNKDKYQAYGTLLQAYKEISHKLGGSAENIYHFVIKLLNIYKKKKRNGEKDIRGSEELFELCSQFYNIYFNEKIQQQQTFQISIGNRDECPRLVEIKRETLDLSDQASTSSEQSAQSYDTEKSADFTFINVVPLSTCRSPSPSTLQSSPLSPSYVVTSITGDSKLESQQIDDPLQVPQSSLHSSHNQGEQNSIWPSAAPQTDGLQGTTTGSSLAKQPIIPSHPEHKFGWNIEHSLPLTGQSKPQKRSVRTTTDSTLENQSNTNKKGLQPPTLPCAPQSKRLKVTNTKIGPNLEKQPITTPLPVQPFVMNSYVPSQVPSSVQSETRTTTSSNLQNHSITSPESVQQYELNSALTCIQSSRPSPLASKQRTIRLKNTKDCKLIKERIITPLSAQQLVLNSQKNQGAVPSSVQSVPQVKVTSSSIGSKSGNSSVTVPDSMKQYVINSSHIPNRQIVPQSKNTFTPVSSLVQQPIMTPQPVRPFGLNLPNIQSETPSIVYSETRTTTASHNFLNSPITPYVSVQQYGMHSSHIQSSCQSTLSCSQQTQSLHSTCTPTSSNLEKQPTMAPLPVQSLLPSTNLSALLQSNTSTGVGMPNQPINTPLPVKQFMLNLPHIRHALPSTLQSKPQTQGLAITSTATCSNVENQQLTTPVLVPQYTLLPSHIQSPHAPEVLIIKPVVDRPLHQPLQQSDVPHSVAQQTRQSTENCGMVFTTTLPKPSTQQHTQVVGNNGMNLPLLLPKPHQANLKPTATGNPTSSSANSLNTITAQLQFVTEIAKKLATTVKMPASASSMNEPVSSAGKSMSPLIMNLLSSNIPSVAKTVSGHPIKAPPQIIQGLMGRAGQTIVVNVKQQSMPKESSSSQPRMEGMIFPVQDDIVPCITSDKSPVANTTSFHQQIPTQAALGGFRGMMSSSDPLQTAAANEDVQTKGNPGKISSVQPEMHRVADDDVPVTPKLRQCSVKLKRYIVPHIADDLSEQNTDISPVTLHGSDNPLADATSRHEYASSSADSEEMTATAPTSKFQSEAVPHVCEQPKTEGACLRNAEDDNCVTPTQKPNQCPIPGQGDLSKSKATTLLEIESLNETEDNSDEFPWLPSNTLCGCSTPRIADNLPEGLSDYERSYLQSMDIQNQILSGISHELHVLRRGFYDGFPEILAPPTSHY